MRNRDSFFWPTLGTDLRTFCISCDKCQRVSPKERAKNVPLVKVPIITEPRSRVFIDLQLAAKLLVPLITFKHFFH